MLLGVLRAVFGGQRAVGVHPAAAGTGPHLPVGGWGKRCPQEAMSPTARLLIGLGETTADANRAALSWGEAVQGEEGRAVDRGAVVSGDNETDSHLKHS